MDQIVEVVLVALMIAVMAIVVVVSYWGLGRFVRLSKPLIAKDWRSMDRRQRRAFVGTIVVCLVVVGAFAGLVRSDESRWAVAIAAVLMVVTFVASIATAVIESRKAWQRAQAARDTEAQADAS